MPRLGMGINGPVQTVCLDMQVTLKGNDVVEHYGYGIPLLIQFGARITIPCPVQYDVGVQFKHF